MNDIKLFSEKLLSEIISNSNLDNGYDINNGSCDFFAEKISSNFPDKNIEIITTDDLIDFIDGNKQPSEEMSESVKIMFHQIESKLFKDDSFVDINTVLYEMGYHEWVFDLDSGLHYDAESTSGVSDISDIPFIRDHVFISMARSGYFSDKRGVLIDSLKKLTSRVMENTSENSALFNEKRKLLNIAIKDMERIYTGITSDLKSNYKYSKNDLSI